ncbi:MAG: branched-chain amino acid ABC transporter permease, partial [Limnochordales bacterium]
ILAALFTFLVLRSLVHSRMGRALIAIREDEVAAQTMGIDTARLKVASFTLAAFFAGIAGALFAYWFRYLNPSSFGFMVSIELLAMVVFGGLGNLLGSVVGAGVMTYLPEFLRTVAPAIAERRLVFYGALLVIVMILRPNGLLGTSSEQGWLEIWLARRRSGPQAARGVATGETPPPASTGGAGRGPA